MKIIAIEIDQSGQKLYETAFLAEELDSDIFKVDYWKKTNHEGYQRIPTKARISAFAKFITTKKSSPVSVTLSLREETVEIKELIAIDEYRRVVEIEIPDELWIIDGQHRIAGLKKLLADGNSQYSTFTLPAIITLTGKKDNFYEAEQFVLINKTQKSVRTDLAEQYLIRLKTSGTDVETILNLPSVITKNIEWKPKAIEIAEILTNGTIESPWENMIIFPNEESQERRGKIATLKSFTDSLKPILVSQSFKNYTSAEIAIFLGTYWVAIEELCPDAFNNRGIYVIQKTTGMYSLHSILETLLSVASSTDKDSIKDILSQMKGKVNGIDRLLIDSELWESDGYFGMLGSSQKVFNIISDMLSGSIHKISPSRVTARPFDVPEKK